MAGVMVIEPGVGFLKQLPEPVVPDLELPYTEEECQPLPPEDEEDDEMADGSAVEEQGKSGGSKGREAEDGDGNQEKSAEMEHQEKAAEDETCNNSNFQ